MPSPGALTRAELEQLPARSVARWLEHGRQQPAVLRGDRRALGVRRAGRPGTGAGRAALEALCRAYEERGCWKLVSRIFPENTASIALHERVGFRVVGIYRRHGKLGSEWRDCVIVEKLLGDVDA